MNSETPSLEAPKASFKEVLKNGRPYWKRYALGVVFIGFVNALEMIPPAAVSLAVDSLRGEVDPNGWFPWLISSVFGQGILTLALVLVGAVSLQWILRYGWRVCFIFTREYVGKDIRKKYFYKLTRLPDSFYSRAQTGELMSLASNDVDAVRMMMGPCPLLFVDAFFYFTFVGILLFSWHVKLSLCLVATIPILPFIVRYFSRQIHLRFQKVQEQLALISAHAQETFSGIGVIKNFVREEKERERFAAESEKYLELNLSLARIQAVFWPFMSFVVGIQALIVLWVGGGAVQNGELSTGEFVGFFLALWLLTWPTVALGWVINMYQKGVASLGRIMKILSEETLDEGGRGQKKWTPEGDIVFENVTFSYEDSQGPALQDINLSVPLGGTLAVVGPVGSGKTTLLKLILKFYRPQEGKICIGSESLEEIPSPLLRRQIGYVPQENFLFSTTIAENIALGIEEEDEEIIHWAAKMAGIHDEITDFPDGYQTQLGEKGVNLSGGQKQRISIARALVLQTPLLVLDDCLSSVDTQTEERILSNLRQVRENSTVLLATHRLTAITDAETIVVLEKGRILEQGTHAELMEREGWYKKTYQQQLVERELEGPEDSYE